MNGYLLDSHVWIWALCRPLFLSSKTLDILNDADEKFFISIATPWELFIKHAKKPMSEASQIFDAGSAGIRLALKAMNVAVLDISLEDAFLAPQLPMPQADPFDRMIVAQAQLRRLTVITSDRKMLGYPHVEFVSA